MLLTEESQMKKVIIAVFICVGFTLAGASTASAAPANNSAISDANKNFQGVRARLV
jgi:hypothetical protein